jgi:CPA2 family monovalent cation:H+ antiporter-2
VHDSSILQDVVLLYSLALVFLLIGGRLRAPVIVSLIATGVAAGPGALGLVGSEDNVALLSELGIALLLFMVGLDLSVAEVQRSWRRVTVGGIGQMLLTVVLAAPIVWIALSRRIDTAVFVGFYIAVSSTSIIVRELGRRNELHAPHGGLAIGILLLQDVFALVALVLMPVLFGTGSGGLGGALLQIVVIAIGLGLVTRFLLPVLFRLASASGREAFGLMVLVASLGTAWLASLLGLSMTVGAFLAGLMIDESEFSHQIHAEIRPLRDLLTSLFFISVGLLLDPAMVWPIWPILIIAAGIVAVKTTGALGALLLAGAPLRIAGTAALALAQIGEFSFVLGQSAVAAGVLAQGPWQVLLGASVLTMMATPALMWAAPSFGEWLARLRTTADTTLAPEAEEAPLSGHVIILGYGIGGQLIATMLKDIDTPHVVLELNGRAVQESMAAGVHIRYGDAASPEALRSAGVDHALAVVAVLSDPGATERAVKAVRTLNAKVPIIVRTRYRLEAHRMMHAGASIAVAEELEASLEVMAQLLVRLDVPGNVTEVLVLSARRMAGAVSQRAVTAPSLPPETLTAAVGHAPVTTHQLAAGEWAVGQTIAAVNLRMETGATILALRNREMTLAAPPADRTLATGDVLYLLGDDADIQLARAYLTDGPRTPPVSSGRESASPVP